MFLYLLGQQLLSSVLIFWPPNFIVFLREFWGNFKYGITCWFTKAWTLWLAYFCFLIASPLLVLLLFLIERLFKFAPLYSAEILMGLSTATVIFNVLIAVIFCLLIFNVMYHILIKHKKNEIDHKNFSWIVGLFVVIIMVLIGIYSSVIKLITYLFAGMIYGWVVPFLIPGIFIFSTPAFELHIPDLGTEGVFLPIFTNVFFFMVLIAVLDSVLSAFSKYDLSKNILILLGSVPFVFITHCIWKLLFKAFAFVMLGLLIKYMHGMIIFLFALLFLPIICAIPVSWLCTFYTHQERLLSK